MKLNKSLMGQRALETPWSLLFSSYHLLFQPEMSYKWERQPKTKDLKWLTFTFSFWPHFYNFENWQCRKAMLMESHIVHITYIDSRGWKLGRYWGKVKGNLKGEWAAFHKQMKSVMSKRSTICVFVDCRGGMLNFYLKGTRNCTENARIKK